MSMSLCHMTLPTNRKNKQKQSRGLSCSSASLSLHSSWSVHSSVFLWSHPSVFCIWQIHPKPKVTNRLRPGRVEPRCSQALWLALALLSGKISGLVVLVLQLLFLGSCVKNVNHNHIQLPGRLIKMVLIALVSVQLPVLCDHGQIRVQYGGF